MRLKCRSNKLKDVEGKIFQIPNLTIGNEYEVFFTASTKTSGQNIILFFNDKQLWVEVASNDAIQMFEPITMPATNKY